MRFERNMVGVFVAFLVFFPLAGQASKNFEFANSRCWLGGHFLLPSSIVPDGSTVNNCTILFDPIMEQSIRVAVRLRPEEKEKETSSYSLSSSQTSSSSSSSCVDSNEITNALKISKNKDGGGSESFGFTFDNVWGTNTSQEAIFEEVKEMINESLQGFSVTIFAFGMTGSGKTYTIAGTPQQPGIVPRAVRHIFTDLQRNANKASDSVAMVFITYVELYNNVLYDLLAPDLPLGEDNSGLRLHEHPKKGVVITGSPTIRTPVSSANEALQLISRGNKLRATSATNMNERSSRSHTVISFEIVCQDGKNSSAKVGKINFVDLAGSERVKLSGAEGTISILILLLTHTLLFTEFYAYPTTHLLYSHTV